MKKGLILLILICVVFNSYCDEFKGKKIKIGYICKMGDHPWFVQEIEGAKAKAAQLGIELETQDVQLDAVLTLETMDRMIANEVHGIVIVAPDKKLGPLVIQKAKDANIPLLAVDDEIKDAEGNSASYVGTDGHVLGQQVGTEIARIYKAENFAAKGNNVMAISVDDPNITVCMLRSKGAEDAFTEQIPDFPKENILHIPYNNTDGSAKIMMASTIVANKDVTHWLIWSANDGGVIGAIEALEDAGYLSEHIIGVGIGGAMSYQIFNSPDKNGFRSTVWIDAKKMGSKAISVIYDKITKGNEMPAKSILNGTLVSPENFETYRSVLKK